jgi:hypothetical protein
MRGISWQVYDVIGAQTNGKNLTAHIEYPLGIEAISYEQSSRRLKLDVGRGRISRAKAIASLVEHLSPPTLSLLKAASNLIGFPPALLRIS